MIRLKARYRYRAMIGLCPYRFLTHCASISRADHSLCERELRKPSQKMPSIAEPPTSSASTLAVLRATVVQTPTASPIVAALPRVAVTTHCRSWGLAHSRWEARWLLYDPRRLLDRAWRDSLPRATSGDTEYR